MPTVRPQAPQKKTYGQSRSAAVLALCMLRSFQGSTVNSFMQLLLPFVVHSCMRAFICLSTFVSQATNQMHLVTGKSTTSSGLFRTALPLLVSIRPGAHPGT